VVGENLIAEEDALFVEPGDAAGFAAAIERLVREPELISKLAINARNAYDRYFGIDRFGTGFLEVLEEAIVIGNPRRGRSDAALVTHARPYEPASRAV
jgi:glycosyltransferase involved in cell wall biosynthesis